MFDKKFFNTPLGLKHILAYELYVTHGLYQKDIAKFLGCSSNTVANYIKKLNKYKYLNDFRVLMKAKSELVADALIKIKGTKDFPNI